MKFWGNYYIKRKKKIGVGKNDTDKDVLLWVEKFGWRFITFYNITGSFFAYIFTRPYIKEQSSKGDIVMAHESEFYVARFEREETREISEETVLAEHLPDIRKILVCDASISLPESRAEGGEIMTEVTLTYGMIYEGSDGGVYSVTEERDYSFVTACEDSGGEYKVDVKIDGMTARATSERRAVFKGRLVLRVFMQSKAEDGECMTEGNVPVCCEALCKEAEYCRICVSEREEFILRDEVISDIPSDGVRIIYCHSVPLVSDVAVNCGEMSASVRGEVDTDIIVCDDSKNESPRSIRRKTPFSFTIELGGDSLGDGCIGTAQVKCEKSEAAIEESGISLSMSCGVIVTAVSCMKERICDDIYSPTSGTEAIFGESEAYVPAACFNKNVSLNHALTVAEAGIDPRCKVVFARAKANIDGIRRGDDGDMRVYICGKAVFYIVSVNDSDEGYEYFTNEVSVPFKYDISREMRCDISEGMAVQADVDILRCFARSDGERVGLDAELCFSVLAMKKAVYRGVCGVRMLEKSECYGNTLRIVYPTSEDSIWTVAKRTRSRIMPMLQKNSIDVSADISSSEVLKNTKFLIV